MRAKARRLALGLALAVGIATTAQATILDDVFIAIRDGDAATVRQLLGKGLDPDSVDPQGNTLLMLSIQNRQPEISRLLLKWHARPNRRNQHGDTALRIAALHGQLMTVRDLVAAGAQVNMPGWTPLIYAAFNGHTAVVDFLLGQGAEVNAVSDADATALMVAARNGHLETARRLLAAGAEPNHVNTRGETAIDWALNAGHTNVAELIEKSGGVPGDAIQRFELKPNR